MLLFYLKISIYKRIRSIFYFEFKLSKNQSLTCVIYGKAIKYELEDYSITHTIFYFFLFDLIYSFYFFLSPIFIFNLYLIFIFIFYKLIPNSKKKKKNYLAYFCYYLVYFYYYSWVSLYFLVLHGSYCNISATFQLYLWYFQQKKNSVSAK